MPSITKCIVLCTLALSGVAANHGQRLSRNTHHDVSARRPLVAAPEIASIGAIQKRASNAKRCKATTTSLSLTSTGTSSKVVSTSSKYIPTTSTYTPTTSKYTPTTSSKSATSASGLTTGGVGTYFLQDGVAGACGTVHPDSAIICALQAKLYANGANCGKTVEVTNTKSGKTVSVTVADECPSCDNAMSIDFSQGAFEALGGTVSEGEFPIAFKLL